MSEQLAFALDDRVACTACGEQRPPSAFRPDARKNNGLRSVCRACDRAAARYRYAETAASKRDYHRERRLINPAGYRARDRRANLARLGATEREYEHLYGMQDGVCVGCQQPEVATRAGRHLRLAVDHDHDTGTIRGLLCGNCNKALGLVGEDHGRLRRLANYIEYFNWEKTRTGS